jgi:hypothetical protein
MKEKLLIAITHTNAMDGDTGQQTMRQEGFFLGNTDDQF